MAVVWGTIKDHKGYINVQSTEGKGTTFTLYFPVTRKEAAGDKPIMSIKRYMGKGESILIVDDLEKQREIASGILSKLGYLSHQFQAVKQKAIIASGFSETDHVQEAQRLGAGAYVKKPYILEKIGMAVRSELDETSLDTNSL